TPGGRGMRHRTGHRVFPIQWKAPLRGGGGAGLPLHPGHRGRPGNPFRRSGGHSPPPLPPLPLPGAAVLGWATAMARLLACMLPLPAARLTPMLPDALANALPDRLALLV